MAKRLTLFVRFTPHLLSEEAERWIAEKYGNHVLATHVEHKHLNQGTVVKRLHDLLDVWESEGDEVIAIEVEGTVDQLNEILSDERLKKIPLLKQEFRKGTDGKLMLILGGPRKYFGSYAFDKYVRIREVKLVTEDIP